MEIEYISLLDATECIIDNRGRTCPTVPIGKYSLIATNCISNEYLYPRKINVRYIDQFTYENWFRGHPKKGDIIFVTKGDPGRCCIVPEEIDFVIAQDMVTLRAKNDTIDTYYLLALLRSDIIKNAILNLHVGTMIPHFKKGDFGNLLLPFPKLAMQEAIGYIFKNIEHKIELLRQMNETLEAMARALFQSWFVDFDPVRKKAEGITTGLPKEIEDLFPSEFEDSELGEIPKGWKVGKLGDVIVFNPTYSLKKDNIYKFLEMKNMEENSPNPKIWDNKNFAGGSKFQNYDTLLARITPCLENGKTCYVQFLNDKELGFGSTEYIVMRTNNNIPKCYSYLIGKNESFRDYAISHLNGSSGRQRVEKDSLSKYQIPLPITQSIWDKFGEKTNVIFSKIHEGYLEQQILTNLRDSLLPKLISGELELSDKMISKILEPA